jgi:uncharacterized membrane-anchored protein
METKRLIVGLLMIPFGIIQSILILPALLWMFQYNLDTFSIIVLLFVALIPGYIIKWLYTYFIYRFIVGEDEIEAYNERYPLIWKWLPIYEWYVGICEIKDNLRRLL